MCVPSVGSERLKNSQSIGQRLVEATYINKSLSVLSDVLTALGHAKKGNFVPFRNSKLTHLLQDCFVGSAKCLVFVNISPSPIHAGETVCSLQFASRCSKVKLGPSHAAVDGWKSKYSNLLRDQQSAFDKEKQELAGAIKALKKLIKEKGQPHSSALVRIVSISASNQYCVAVSLPTR